MWSYVMRRCTSFSLLFARYFPSPAHPLPQTHNNYRLVWVVRNQLSLFLSPSLFASFFLHFIQFFDIFLISSLSMLLLRRHLQQKEIIRKSRRSFIGEFQWKAKFESSSGSKKSPTCCDTSQSRLVSTRKREARRRSEKNCVCFSSLSFCSAQI